MAPALISLSPNLISQSVNGSVDFYTKHLGFSLIASVPEQGTYDWAMIQRDSVTLMFQSLPSLQQDMPSLNMETKGSLGTFFIKMKGIDELYNSVNGKVEISLDMRTTFYGMKEFVVRDPDGYFMCFAEEV
jgi:uncharacterized glyoxalase superfamily protein PhnB